MHLLFKIIKVFIGVIIFAVGAAILGSSYQWHIWRIENEKVNKDLHAISDGIMTFTKKYGNSPEDITALLEEEKAITLLKPIERYHLLKTNNEQKGEPFTIPLAVYIYDDIPSGNMAIYKDGTLAPIVAEVLLREYGLKANLPETLH
jgi:hypothetical protein